jgi:hypothetical protein
MPQIGSDLVGRGINLPTLDHTDPANKAGYRYREY